MGVSDKKLNEYREKMIAVENEIKKVVIGIDDVVELMVKTIFSRGHVLLDGLPGLAKTLLCLATARALNGEMIRYQGRPDFLPNQFLYTTEPDKEGNPKFYEGPLITKADRIVVALLDEVTRFITQSQAFWFDIMNEFQVILATKKVLLPHIRVLATKNKVTRGETFEIPQPQSDRFSTNIELHYPDRDSEIEIIKNEKFDDPGKLVLSVNPIINLDELEEIVDGIQAQVRISDVMVDYLYKVMYATRFPLECGVKLEGIENIDDLVDNRQNASGVSPRGGGKWRRIAKVAALRRGSEYVVPEDVRDVAQAVLCHRIFINPPPACPRNRATLARDFLEAVLDKIEVPQ